MTWLVSFQEEDGSKDIGMDDLTNHYIQPEATIA
jgi:hypothetical protein